MKEEKIMDNFQLVNDITFLTYSAQSDMYKVNRTQARLLNKKYGVEIFWHSLKRGGAEFNSYLAYFGYPQNENFWIEVKLVDSQLKFFQELDPKYGTGVDY
jgi:hypothetical protein